jgi:type IV fimbrial biogenesis protein FimT
LIEAMTAVAIGAVLTAITVPYCSTILRNSEIRSTTESIVYGLRLARNEAIRRNGVVTFALVAGGDSPSWAVKQVSDGSTIQTSSAQEDKAYVSVVAKPTAARSVTYNPFGRVIQDDADAPAIEQLAISSATAAGARPLQITVDGMRGIRTCDPSSLLVAPDPRAC